MFVSRETRQKTLFVVQYMQMEHSGEYNIFDVVKLQTRIIFLKGNKSRNLSVVEMSIIFLQRSLWDVRVPFGELK